MGTTGWVAREVRERHAEANDDAVQNKAQRAMAGEEQEQKEEDHGIHVAKEITALRLKKPTVRHTIIQRYCTTFPIV